MFSEVLSYTDKFWLDVLGQPREILQTVDTHPGNERIRTKPVSLSILINNKKDKLIKLFAWKSYALKLKNFEHFDLSWLFFTASGGYLSRDAPDHKRPRKWTNYNYIWLLSKLERITLSNKKVRAFLEKYSEKTEKNKNILFLVHRDYFFTASGGCPSRDAPDHKRPRKWTN